MVEKLHDHHIVHHRRLHEANDDNKWIRRRGGLIVPMVLEVHKDLHDNCPGVPVLDIYMARRVKGIMMRHDISEPLVALDTYCMAVETAMETARHEPERLIGEAAIMAIRMQIPFIKEGMRDGVA